MKTILILVAAYALSGCETVGDGQARLIYSEAGGMFSVFTGRASSCTFLKGPDSDVDLESMEFDPATNKCKATLGTESAPVQ